MIGFLSRCTNLFCILGESINMQMHNVSFVALVLSLLQEYMVF